jgi:membrane-bound serine protease (ClpP class)
VVLTAQASSGSAAQGVSIDIVKVQGIIDPAEAAYVRSTIQDAEVVGATVVLQIDSLGQYGDLGAQLGRFIRAASVPVIAWVGSTGARAEGGALYLVYGSSLATMAPGAGIGPGPPFDLGTRASAESRVARARNVDALTALAPGAGATEAGARAAIGTALAAQPALDAGAVVAVDRDIPSLLRDLDGRTVRAGGGTVALTTLAMPGHPVSVRFHEIGVLRRTLHAVGTPVAAFVLLVLGMWAVAFELTQPGLGIAGIAGVPFLALAGYGLWVVSVHWVGLAVLIVGVGLWGLDVIVRRLSWLTAAGTAMFVGGSLLAWWGVAPAIRVPVWLIGLLTVGGVLLFGFGFTVALQARERIRSQQVGLVGLTGEARSDIDPEGGVVVKGAVWRARSANGKIPKGTKVRVRGIDGLVLRVEPEPED